MGVVVGVVVVVVFVVVVVVERVIVERDEGLELLLLMLLEMKDGSCCWCSATDDQLVSPLPKNFAFPKLMSP